MKLTHPFVVLIVLGTALSGGAWLAMRPAPPPTEALVPAKAPSQAKQDDGADLSQEPPALEAGPAAEHAWQVEAKRLVIERLKDPESARFQDITRRSDDEVCGQVNAKNAMGGYVGHKWFWIKNGQTNSPTVLLDSDAKLAELICTGGK